MPGGSSAAVQRCSGAAVVACLFFSLSSRLEGPLRATAQQSTAEHSFQRPAKQSPRPRRSLGEIFKEMRLQPRPARERAVPRRTEASAELWAEKLCSSLARRAKTAPLALRLPRRRGTRESEEVDCWHCQERCITSELVTIPTGPYRSL